MFNERGLYVWSRFFGVYFSVLTGYKRYEAIVYGLFHSLTWHHPREPLYNFKLFSFQFCIFVRSSGVFVLGWNGVSGLEGLGV